MAAHEDDWTGWGVARLGALLRDGKITAVELTTRCLRRIELIDPLVHAVLALAPDALAQAAAADRRLSEGGAIGPLDGIPVLLKDNVDTAGLATTAGSRLLAGSPPERDADIVVRLRRLGAVLLGKTNLSEWSNFRSADAVEGWSAVGGQTGNPYVLGHSPWGSSAGSAVAVAAGMVPLAIGTETDGSVVGPAGINGVVGVKPEPGLLPGRGIVPISAELDTVGLFTRTVGDAQLSMSALTGGRRPAGAPESVAGKRFGLWQPVGSGPVAEVCAAVTNRLRASGADVVPVDLEVPGEVALAGLVALHAEFRTAVEDYLRTRPDAPGSVAELVEANRADPVELGLFGQDLFEWVATMSADERDSAAAERVRVRSLARALWQDKLHRHKVDALLAPTNEPAWPIEKGRGDRGRLSTSTLAALAGYPAISLPAGFAGPLPIGLSVFGPDRVDRLLPVAAAVERVCGDLRAPGFLTADALSAAEAAPSTAERGVLT